MSFRTDLQLAPEQRGIIQNQSAWVGGGGSTSVVTFSGIYTGLAKVTITINSNSVAITIGSGTATIYWSGSDGSTGTLYVGTGYTAGTALLFYEGVSVAFAAGTVDDLDSMTVDLQALRALPEDYAFLEAFQGGSSSTADVILAAVGRESRDGMQAFLNGDAGVVRTAIARSPSITVDWMDDVRGDALLYMEETRIPLMVGEDFDATTLFLWRGGGLTPLIGPPGAFVRATVGSYLDKRTGLFKIAPSGTSRQRAGKCGLATAIDAGACTNLLPRFHAKSGTLGWTAAGSATAAFDSGVRPLLDVKDTGWTDTFRAGVLRAYLPIGGGNTLDADDATVAASTNYVGQVWVKGRGRITCAIRFGVGAVTRTATTSAPLDLSKDWQRIVVTGVSIVAENRADLMLSAVSHNSVVYVGPAQIEAGLVASTIVQTDGATATRNAETLSFPITIPVHEGTLGFWFYWPGDDGASSYSIVETTGVSGTQRFAIRYNSSTSLLSFFTATTGQLSYNIDLAADTWYHVAVLWVRGSTASELIRTIYLNGAAVVADSTTSWQPYFGSALGIAPDLAGSDLRGIRFEEMRLDAEFKSSIADWYDRLTDAAWLHVHRDLAGRAFGISSASFSRRSTAHPDHYVANLGLQQLKVYDGSEIAAR